jgi:GT2 family glycosyltransferase
LTPQAETAPPQPPRVSVVIVSFNRAAALRRSLETLGQTHQIVVVDNGSADDTPLIEEEFPAVRFRRLPRNFGLTKALNIGLRVAEGEYILCLHDDTRISADAVTKLADYLEAHPEVGAVSPLLTDESGAPAPQVRALPSPAAPDMAFQPAPAGEEITVACVSGAAIMFREFVLHSLRQIDERYGNFGSDIELCAQLGRASKKIVVLRSVTAIHESDPSPMFSNVLAGDRVAGLALFLGKHHGFFSGLVYRLKVALSALFTLRFQVLAGALSGQKIDGTR